MFTYDLDQRLKKIKSKNMVVKIENAKITDMNMFTYNARGVRGYGQVELRYIQAQHYFRSIDLCPAHV